jgi:hypothetical protein
LFSSVFILDSETSEEHQGASEERVKNSSEPFSGSEERVKNSSKFWRILAN